jgi:hypothetical protein
MGSSAGAKVLLVVGFLAAWLGYDAWLVSHVVLDPNATRAAAHALLETPAVRNSLTDQLTQQVDSRVPAATGDPRVAAAVATTLRDPRVVAAFTDTIVSIHRSILSGTNQKVFTVDGTAVRAALQQTLAQQDPPAAAQVAKLPPLDVRITTNKLPDVHDPRDATNGVALLATVAAVLLVAASLVLRHDRRAVARVGRRIAYLAITPLLVFFVLPRVLEHASGSVPEVASTLLRTYGNRVLPSAIALVVVGVMVTVGALTWPRNRFELAPGTPPPPDPGQFPAYGPGGLPTPGAPDPDITDRLYL